MSHDTIPLPDPVDLLAVARLEEARQARGTADVADESLHAGGGIASFAGIGSWANQASGMGMSGPVSADDLDGFIDFYERRGVEPRIEVCPYADASLIDGLAERGFVTRLFENVLVRDLSMPLPSLPAGVQAHPVDPADASKVQTFFDIAVEGFGIADRGAWEHTERRMLAHPACRPFIATVDGLPAGVGNCDATPPIGGLFGMTTLEPFRRRGVQQALMLARLAACRDNGCRWAAIHSEPYVATGRNALRLGFFVAYTKSVMVRPGPGLVPSP